ncbi:EamA/RhaT family transporter, partial [Vibrio parahaemolyticus]|nr:EamA/RhaT family transporter [Vibrio parahaemolyticus]
MFLVCSLIWSVFTISERVANIKAYVCAGFVAIVSLLMLIIAVGFGWIDIYLALTPISSWPWEELF